MCFSQNCTGNNYCLSDLLNATNKENKISINNLSLKIRGKVKFVFVVVKQNMQKMNIQTKLENTKGNLNDKFGF